MVIFISYSSKEYEEAFSLKTVLESNVFKCWMAPNSIPPGSDYGSEVVRAIQNCDVFVLLLSRASQASVWVPKEVDKALSFAKPVIPLHIDQSSLSDAFDFRLSNVQRIEAYMSISEGYKALIERLKAFAGNERKAFGL